MLIGDLSQLNSLDLFQNPLLQYLHSNDSPCLFSIYNIIIVALFCFSPTFFARKISSSFFVHFSNKVVKPKCKTPFSRLIRSFLKFPFLISLFKRFSLQFQLHWKNWPYSIYICHHSSITSSLFFFCFFPRKSIIFVFTFVHCLN